MIIDIHTHFGNLIKFSMPKKNLIGSMKKYSIDFSLTSNIEGIEFTQDGKELPFFLKKNQININKKAINFARKNKDKIGVLLWIKPNREIITEQFEELIFNNLDFIYGIKFHPFYSRISIEDKKLEPYLNIAKKYNLPFCVHTAYDGFSNPQFLYNISKKWDSINFICYHLGLESNNDEAIDYISRVPNLYGDSAWVIPENILKAIEKCGENKILFGSDNPIDGIDTYNNSIFYKIYFSTFKDKLSIESYNNFFYKNALKLFKIRIKQ